MTIKHPFLQHNIRLFMFVNSARLPFTWESHPLSHHLHEKPPPFSCCHLEEKAPWQITKSPPNGNNNSQCTQFYPNTSPFHSTNKRHLDFLQNDDSIRYTCKYSLYLCSGVKYPVSLGNSCVGLPVVLLPTPQKLSTCMWLMKPVSKV